MPALALAPLKLVCRTWRAMLDSDRFVRWQNDMSATRAATTGPVSIIFVNPFGSTAPVPEEIVDPMEEPTVVSLTSCSSPAGSDRRAKLPPLSKSRVVCRNPCRGLVLLSHQHGNGHALCNPVTQAWRGFSISGKGHGCAGLGYDRSKEEHVIVRLSYTSTGDQAMECLVWPLRYLHPRRTPLACLPTVPVAVDVPPVHVAGKMYWPAEQDVVAFDISTEAFELVPGPPTDSDVTGGDRVVLAELAGKLCAAHLSATTETMTVWGKNGVDGWTRDHVIELQHWPEFSPRATGQVVIPMAVDPVDGRILLDTGKALGYYDPQSRTLETVYSLKAQLADRRIVTDDIFVIAAICEDSLFCPYPNRKYRLW